MIGTGHIGGTLGAKWHAAGHDVTYGSRQGSGDGPGGAPLRPIGDAAADADVVVIAVPGGAVPDVVAEHGKVLGGKVVVDATNQMGAGHPDNRDTITAGVANVKYVRAFNIYGWENFAEPLPGTTLFFAADPAAREAAEELISAIGMEPAYVGGVDATGIVDGLLPLWFSLVQERGGQRRLSFRLLEP